MWLCNASRPKMFPLHFRAVYLNIPLFAVLVSLFALIGLVMYGVYHDCDPLLAGKIQKRDQVSLHSKVN